MRGQAGQWKPQGSVEGKPMSTGKKIGLGILIFFVVIVVGLIIVVPRLVDIDRYRPQVVARLQEETGKPVEIGRLALTILPQVSIRVDDFALGNPPGFPKGDFVRAQRIYAVVDAGALWNRQVVITSLQLDKPTINLLSDIRGKWNFENPAKPSSPAAPPAGNPAGFTLGVISKATVRGGELKAANLLASGRPGPNFFEARAVTIALEQVDLNAFVTAASASFVPRGTPRPSTAGGFGATVLYAAPPAQPAAQGTLQADSLRFGTLQATRVKSKLRLFPKQVYFDDLSFNLYGGRAVGDLEFNLAGQNPRYSTSARISGVDVAKLLEAFPEARGKMTGTMEGNMKLSGEVTHSPDPLAGMRGTGQLSIKNGQLPSLQLNKNLMLLARLTNLGPASGDPSSFSSISTDLNIANERITSKKIAVVGNGVEVDGSGSMTMAGAGSLDYQGNAKVAAGQNPVTGLLAGLSGATFAEGKLSFPFTLSGTLQEPKFSVKSGAAVGGLRGLLGGKQQTTTPEGQTQQQTPQDLVKGLTGLFKKKQPAQQQTQPK
jgi:uncharacterized protein involved in outer membrane biogenesis